MALIPQNLLLQHLAVVNESEADLSKRHGNPEHKGDCFATRVVSELPTLVNPHEDTHESHLNPGQFLLLNLKGQRRHLLGREDYTG